MAHKISDAVYERLTGEKGYFDTRVVFVAESGARNKRHKRLAIMDQDGANLRYLTDGHSIVMTPRFSPTARRSPTCRSGRPATVYLLQIETGRREILGDFPGMVFAPRFSPDGQKVIWASRDGGNSDIYVMDLQPLVHAAHLGVDRHLALVLAGRLQDRLQLRPLRLAADLRNGRRRSGHPGSPTAGHVHHAGLEPDRRIHRLHQADGRRVPHRRDAPDGSDERLLTSSYLDEGPTWAPNGRVLMFFREASGSGGPKLYSIDLTGRNEQAIGTANFASDPAWSPLLE